MSEETTNEPIVIVADSPSELRYELRVNEQLAATVAYRLEPGVVVLVHTDVEPAFEGRGFGSRLAQGTLDDIRARGLSVAPICPFLASWVRRHREYLEMVVPDPAVSD